MRGARGRYPPPMSHAAAFATLGFLLAVTGAFAREDLSTLSAVDPESREDLGAVFRAGAQASAEEASGFEKRLAADPKDLEARLLLLARAATEGSSGGFVERVLGLIEHHARAPVADAVARVLESA